MMAFSRKVARGAYLVTAADVEELKKHGFTDGEVFDISAAVGARAFWTNIIESLGVAPEPPFLEMQQEFRKTLTVGRPIGNGGPTLATETDRRIADPRSSPHP